MTWRLSTLGVTVIAAGRSQDRLDEVAAQSAGTVFPVVADVADVESAPLLVRTALEHTGRLDIAIANAGVYLPGDIWETDPLAIKALVDTNVTGAIATVQAAAQHMRETGIGDIVVTSSVSGHQAIQWEPVYSGSKHAIQSFVHGVRRQLVGSGVRIGSLAPGTTLNELWSVTDPEEVARLSSEGLGLQSEDVADALVFMLTRPRHSTIRDLVLLPTNQDL